MPLTVGVDPLKEARGGERRGARGGNRQADQRSREARKVRGERVPRLGPRGGRFRSALAELDFSIAGPDSRPAVEFPAPSSVVVCDLAHPVRTDRRRPCVKKVEFCGDFPPCRSDATSGVFHHACSETCRLSLFLFEDQQNSSVLTEGPGGCAAVRKRPRWLAWRRQL